MNTVGWYIRFSPNGKWIKTNCLKVAGAKQQAVMGTPDPIGVMVGYSFGGNVVPVATRGEKKWFNVDVKDSSFGVKLTDIKTGAVKEYDGLQYDQAAALLVQEVAPKKKGVIVDSEGNPVVELESRVKFKWYK